MEITMRVHFMEDIMHSSHTRKYIGHCTVFVTLLGLFMGSQPVLAQNETELTGTVVSSSRNTVTVREMNGRYQLFTFDRDVRKPATLPVGSRVRVLSSASDDAGVRVARDITVLQGGGGANAPAGANAGGAPDNVPTEVRQIERGIERQARRYQLGVRAGVALDPELILVGVQSQIGPFFNPDIFFRPNVEFGWGEVSAMFALNAELIYRLPLSSRQGRWASYVGGGPGFNFVHQDFQANGGSGTRVDFSDFHYSVGLNLLAGLRYRSGMFTEIKTSVYSKPAPTLRLILGYNF
jgi:hypothetical protein